MHYGFPLCFESGRAERSTARCRARPLDHYHLVHHHH
jgi:hypothetical protein